MPSKFRRRSVFTFVRSFVYIFLDRSMFYLFVLSCSSFDRLYFFRVLRSIVSVVRAISFVRVIILVAAAAPPIYEMSKV